MLDDLKKLERLLTPIQRMQLLYYLCDSFLTVDEVLNLIGYDRTRDTRHDEEIEKRTAA